MNDYDAYTVALTFRSSLATPLHADTLFGHLCWAFRYMNRDGEEGLSKCLARFDKNGHPPLLISNGIPKGCLPKPSLPAPDQALIDRIVEPGHRMAKAYWIKKLARAEFISADLFARLQQKGLSPQTLFQEMADARDEVLALESRYQDAVTQHNTINRWTNRVESGRLFNVRERFFDQAAPLAARFDIYIRTNFFAESELRDLFEFMSQQGFGKGKTKGKGAFSFTLAPGIRLPDAEVPNGFLSLSNFIPKPGDPTAGHYHLLHKFGKLGGTFAQGDPGAGGNPFKVPLLMMAAGACFSDPAFGPERQYGSLIANVHPNPQIRHYAYAFPLGIRLEASERC